MIRINNDYSYTPVLIFNKIRVPFVWYRTPTRNEEGLRSGYSFLGKDLLFKHYHQIIGNTKARVYISRITGEAYINSNDALEIIGFKGSLKEYLSTDKGLDLMLFYEFAMKERLIKKAIHDNKIKYSLFIIKSIDMNISLLSKLTPIK